MHSALDAGIEVSWTMGTTPITKGIAPEGTTKSTLTVSSAKKEDNGKYKCSVKFGSHGTASKQITQYVRYFEAVPSPTSIAIAGAATHTISCMYYGDAHSATVWKFGDVTLTDNDDYDIATTKETDYSTKDVLTINTVEAANEGTYKCSVKYTSDNKAEMLENVVTVYGEKIYKKLKLF